MRRRFGTEAGSHLQPACEGKWLTARPLSFTQDATQGDHSLTPAPPLLPLSPSPSVLLGHPQLMFALGYCPQSSLHTSAREHLCGVCTLSHFWGGDSFARGRSVMPLQVHADSLAGKLPPILRVPQQDEKSSPSGRRQSGGEPGALAGTAVSRSTPKFPCSHQGSLLSFLEILQCLGLASVSPCPPP